MPINKIAYQVLELQYENYINILRGGQSVTDTGWTTYADSPGVNPVDGIGGSPTITWSQNTINPLSGDADLRLVKGAVNRQGDGVSISFTISNRHFAKVLQISFDAELISGNYESPIITSTVGTYSITSTTCTVTAPHSFVQGQVVNMTFTSGTVPPNGTYVITSVTATTFVFTVASGSSTGNCSYTVPADLRISIIQDPTGTPVVIEPVNTGIQLGIANQRIRHIANFQTHLSVTSYRLCIHVSNASTVAYTVDFANFKVWEPTQNIGAVITDWQSYTPIITGYSGTTFTTYFKWRRVGGSVEIVGSYVPSGGSSTTTVGTISIPFGLSANTSDNRDYIVGNGWRSTSNNTAFKNFSVLINTSAPTVLTLALSEYASTFNPFSDSTTLSNLTGLEEIGIQVTVPIAGWGSSVVMSSDSGDGRVVALYVQGTPTASISGDAAITWASLVTNQDTHGAYNFSTGVFTAPISGYYNITGHFNTNASVNAVIRPWINGVNRSSSFGAATSAGFFNIAGGIFLNAGDQLTIRPSGGYSAVSGGSFLFIHRISAGSQVIASVETVGCLCHVSSSHTPSQNHAITFDTIIYDTHGTVTRGTIGGNNWRYTAPMNGLYNIQFSHNGGTAQWISIYVDGSIYMATFVYTAASGTGAGSATIRLRAGQFVYLGISSGSISISGGASLSGYVDWIGINRIGI